ncbi:metallophosphoesterase [uncultured Shewanella sp.]|uniref:metallophosphoesterase family protein n=1 Tax=uncultured Shewanella sp. TaxID=173975 RepID=UPI00263979DD|nr:metallophosphoesterase [uncultured Shewanella sp.]
MRHTTHRKIATLFSFPALILHSYVTCAEPVPSSAWLQYTEQGLEVRALVSTQVDTLQSNNPMDKTDPTDTDESVSSKVNALISKQKNQLNSQSQDPCPHVNVDGLTLSMQVRSAPTSNFPLRVCSTHIPDNAKIITLKDIVLSPAISSPKRIVLVGDTGCRLSGGQQHYQACNNTSVWPFAHIASRIAEYNPDLIIHTGDYIYREVACPKGNAGCSGSPFGHNQSTWDADWFIPAAPMLTTAPFIFIRGNHEGCDKAGIGWFRFLSPRAKPDICQASTPPWFINLDMIQLGIIDSAIIVNEQKQSLAPAFSQQLKTLAPQYNKPAWLLSHRPFWGFGASDTGTTLTKQTSQLQAAVKTSPLPEFINLIISGHIHLAEILDFDGNRPVQVIAGNGGNMLVSRTPKAIKIDNMAIKQSKVLYQYGFIVMESDEKNDWRLSFRDVEGRELEACLLEEDQLFCE